MPTINKQSVREEFDRLKVEFAQLSKKKKLAPEFLALFNALFLLVALILSIFMEKQTKKNSANSSIPPSQTEKDETSLENPGAKSKGKKEKTTQANNTRTVETVTIIPVEACKQCGESLKGVECQCHERRTKIDIIFEKTVEHFDAEVKRCPSCRTITKGTYPADVHGPLQYGNGLKAYVIQFLIAQMVSLNRVQKMLATLIGNTISEATMLAYIMVLYYALEKWEVNAKNRLLKMSSIHVDETSLRVDKKKQWIHVYSSHDITLKFLHKKRGLEAMEDIDIIPLYGGVLIHDCWSSYLTYLHCLHALCGSHLLRELTYIIESNGYVWAKNLKRLLQEACFNVSKKKNKRLSKRAYARLQRRYRNILTRGAKELPPIPEKTNGKRGKVAKSDAHNLWERLVKYEQEVLLFAKESHVAFTNNRAERDLRMAKVKQKVSGCFRVEKYAKAYCRISSYLQTMANKGINPMIAIQMALSGEIYK